MKNNFYIVVPIGFEKLAEQEIISVWPYLIGKDGRPHSIQLPEFEISPGGIEFQAPLELGLQLNFFLKSAVRILYRISEWTCRDFPKLFNKVSEFDWTPYLTQAVVSVEASSHESRMNIKKRIEETVQEALVKKYSKLLPVRPEETAQKVYVRFFKDICTISVDTSGELLFKRGYKLEVGEAPLRENLASLLLDQLIDETSYSELQSFELIDPMAGAGTFLLEARLKNSLVTNRHFQFEKWKLTPKILKEKSVFKNYQLPQFSLFKKYKAFDIEASMGEKVLLNWKSAGVDLHEIEVQTKDLWKLSRESEGENLNWVILNPPYGERISVAKPLNIYFKSLIEQCLKVFQPQRMGLIVPDTVSINSLGTFLNYQLNHFAFKNGGMKVHFIVLKLQK